jgi:hypothetical protein
MPRDGVRRFPHRQELATNWKTKFVLLVRISIIHVCFLLLVLQMILLSPGGVSLLLIGL